MKALFLILHIIHARIVAVEGCVPLSLAHRSVKIEKNGSVPDGKSVIEIVELSRAQNAPGGKKQLCVFKDTPVLDIAVFHKRGASTAPLVSIDPSVDGAYSIAERLFERSFDVAVFEANTSYLIRGGVEGAPDGYERVALSDTPFHFLSNEKFEFVVFGDHDDQVTDRVCRRTPRVIGFYVVVLGLLLLCVLFFHMICYRPRILEREDAKFWVIDKEMRVRFGPDPANVEGSSWSVIEKAAKAAIAKKHSVSFVSRLKRRNLCHSFERVAAVPLANDIAFVVMWMDLLPEFEKMNIDCNFVSETQGILGKPVVSFSSFRDFKPIHVEYTLDNGVRCVADLPASVLAPFQPYGRLVTVVLSVLYDVTQTLTSQLEAGFKEATAQLCRKIGVYRCFFFDSENKLICRYEKDGIPELDIRKIREIPKKVTHDYGFQFIEDLLDDGKRYFAAKLNGPGSGLMIVVSLDSQSDIDTYEENGLPFFGLCCFFIYQLSYEHEQAKKARYILETWSQEKDFAYLEFFWKRKQLIKFVSPWETTNIESYEDLMALIDSVGIQDVDEIRRELGDIAMSEGILSHRVIQDANGTKFHMSAIAFYEYETEDVRVIIVVGKITVQKRKELELSGELKGIKMAMENLGVMKFSVIGDDIVMSDDRLFRMLSQTTNDLHVKRVLDDRDYERFHRLINGEKVTLRLRNGKGEPVWFSASSNKNIGFIFCISTLEEANVVKHPDDERMQIAATSSPLIFWTVDPVTDAVHPLFMQPTIWDALSVDKETKFARFLDYVDSDDRDEFTTHYQEVLDGRANQWNGEVRIMRMGGVYEWHRVVIVRSRNQSLHCIALNVNKQRDMERKLRETQKLRDLLLSSGKLALWKFIDDDQPLEKMETFDPGLMKAVTMNWRFIDEQVAPEYRDEFRECMRKVFSGERPSVEMNLQLLLNKGQPIWVSVRGKLRNNLHQIVGVCVDITELRHAYDELEIEKKRAEEANKQKTIFLANMSHEIRTPMNGIFGVLDILALQELTSEQRLLIDSIRASSFQLMKLLDDTLNLSKIEQGEVESTPVVFSLAKQLEPICIASASRARMNGVKFIVNIDKNVPSLVFGDAQLFIQVFNNLVSNSLKFTKQGSISVRLGWKTEKETETCILEVKDTGIGMTADQQRIIFERFIQADPSVARFYGGTGLGLALVHEIVDFMNGKVSLQSDVGVGTCFNIEIPFESVMFPYSPPFNDGKEHVILAMAADEDTKSSLLDGFENHSYTVKLFTDPEEIMQLSQKDNVQVDVVFVEGNRDQWPQIKHVVNRIPEDQAPVVCSICEPGESAFFKYTLAKPLLLPHVVNFVNGIRYKHLNDDAPGVSLNEDGDQRRILVVEDNRTNQFVMKRILQNLGCSFEIAENGQEAIDTLEKQDFDLIFMDCQMPVLDGVEATKIIRQSHKHYSSIPIVALTASAVEGDEQTCRNAGMDAYLAKPVRIHQISAIIKQFHH